jgi:hypothetical protein
LNTFIGRVQCGIWKKNISGLRNRFETSGNAIEIFSICRWVAACGDTDTDYLSGRFRPLVSCTEAIDSISLVEGFLLLFYPKGQLFWYIST